MKILILTTDTKHHTYFINKISDFFNVIGIVYEQRKLKKTYQTGPFLATEEDEFEERFFNIDFNGTKRTISTDLYETKLIVNSVNDNESIDYIKLKNPDIIISFGTGLIKPRVFNIPKIGTINIHRGFAQSYRGLDSDLWAIYNEEFDKIGVTLHYVDEKLDTGDILLQETIELKKHDKIFHIKYLTTILATEMIIKLLNKFNKYEFPQAYKQLNYGNYYTAMPLKLKYECLNKFENYIGLLK